MKRVFIVVSDLIDTVGHEYEYTRSVAAAFGRRGYTTYVLGGQDAVPEVAALDGFAASFRRVRKPVGARAWPWEVPRQSLLFLLELQRALAPFSFTKEDLIFAPTILQPYFAGWVWCLWQLRNALPTTVLLFRYSLALTHPSRFRMLRQILIPRAYKFLFWIAERCSRKPVLVSDSDDLCKEYERYTRLPIGLVPIPLNIIKMKDIFGSIGQPNPSSEAPRLVYLGDVRRGKGFDLLPPLVEGLYDINHTDFRLIVHCGRPTERYTEPGIKDAYLRLQHLAEKGNVKLITSSLSRSDYYKLLWESDIVLLPYRREYYMGQTSNILAEAFVAGKPVIAPQGTWVGNQVLSSGAGVVFESGEVKSLVTATARAIENLPRYAEAAACQREYWSDLHNADRLVDEIERILDQK